MYPVSQMPDATAAEATNQCDTFFCVCSKFNDLRRDIWEREDGRRGRIDLREILNTPGQAKKAACFMILTRLLGQYGAASENTIT